MKSRVYVPRAQGSHTLWLPFGFTGREPARASLCRVGGQRSEAMSGAGPPFQFYSGVVRWSRTRSVCGAQWGKERAEWGAGLGEPALAEGLPWSLSNEEDLADCGFSLSTTQPLKSEPERHGSKSQHWTLVAIWPVLNFSSTEWANIKWLVMWLTMRGNGIPSRASSEPCPCAWAGQQDCSNSINAWVLLAKMNQETL